MVVLSEVSNMFWGVTLDGGKRYTQTVENSFHISMAALEPALDYVNTPDRFVSLMIQHEKAEFLLCTLEHGKVHQQVLDLNFTEGEEVTFFLNGKGVIHMTGYLAPEEEGEMDESMDDTLGYDSEEEEEEASDEESEEDTDEDIPKLRPVTDDLLGKRKKQQSQKAVKKLKIESEDDDDSDDDEDDEDFILHDAMEEDDDSGSEDDEEEEMDSEEDDEEEDEEDSDEEEDEMSGSFLNKKKNKLKTEKDATPKEGKSKKQVKNAKQDSKEQVKTPKQDSKPATPNGTAETDKKKKRKKKKKNKNKDQGGEQVNVTPGKPELKKTPKGSEQKQQQGKSEQKQTPKSAKKQVLAGNIWMEETKEGHGPLAKQGKMVHVYYTGRLPNGKVFDSCSKGKPMKFKLGANEVIKGWDIGLQGMKVGGKRKLKIPPKMGYGNSKQGPIPANSTLEFDVELKAVS